MSPTVDTASRTYILLACRDLMDSHPGSVRIREQVDALESALPDRPGIAVSFCKTIIETVCKTILTDRNVLIDDNWEAPKLISETVKYLNLGLVGDNQVDIQLRNGVDGLVRGVNQIVGGITNIRNAYGSAAHGGDAYSPLLDSKYAEVMARATDAVVGLLFNVHAGSSRRDPTSRFRYGDHPDFDEFVDELYDQFSVFEIKILASEVLFVADFRAYRDALLQFRQEQNIEQPEGEAEVDPQ